MPYIKNSRRNEISGTVRQYTIELEEAIKDDRFSVIALHNFLSTVIKNMEANKWVMGDMNYTITVLGLNLVKIKGESYSLYNDFMGALASLEQLHQKLEIKGMLRCCATQFYLRYILGYEMRKIEENGDITIE